MTYVEKSNETLTQALNTDIRQVLYVASYNLAVNKQQEKELAKIRNRK